MAGHWVTGLFFNYSSANTVVESLIRLGYQQKDISFIMTEQTRDADLRREEGNKTLEGVGLGASVGGTVGAVVAALAAVGTTLAVPGLGLFIAGPLVAAIAGAGAGSVVGSLMGALVGTGIPQSRAELYEEGLRKGGIVVGVQASTDDEAARLEKLFDEMGAEKIRSLSRLCSVRKSLPGALRRGLTTGAGASLSGFTTMADLPLEGPPSAIWGRRGGLTPGPSPGLGRGERLQPPDKQRPPDRQPPLDKQRPPDRQPPQQQKRDAHA